MHKKTLLWAAAAVALAIAAVACGENIYRSQRVPGENGTFDKLTEEATETIVPPAWESIDTRGGMAKRIISWKLAQRLDISPDGNIAYLAIRDGYTNIFVRNLKNNGATTQRGNRQNVNDVAYSPNGENLCFSERNSDGTSYLFIINAKQGSQIRQISPSNMYDCQPCYSKDGKFIFFARYVGGSASIWSYELATGNFAMLCSGSNPRPINNEEFVYTVENQWGQKEIWKHNFKQGFDSNLKSERGRSFTTGSVSPDGKWLLFVSTSASDTKVKDNLDIYYMRSDGTGGATQITFHEGHDCSPVWSPDGKFIYFLSQRGTEHGEYNIWRVNFAEQENLIDDQYEYTPQQEQPKQEENNNGGIKLPKRRQR